MSELSPRARDLMRRAGPGGGPTEGQRRALKRTVMAAVLVPAAAGAAVTKIVLVGLLVAAVSAGVTVGAVTSLRSTPSGRVALAAAAVDAVRQPALNAPDLTVEIAPPVRPAPGSSSPPVPTSPFVALPRAQRVEPAPPSPSVAAPPPVLPVPQETAPLPPPPGWAPSSRSDGPTGLAREMETLDRALRAVDARHFEEGLLEARRFLSAFPESEFGIEARVVEVLALCGLSRVEEAQTSAANLPTAAAGNPAVRRLDNSCARSPTP